MPDVKQTSPSANKSLDESHDSEPEEEEDHLQFQVCIVYFIYQCKNTKFI